MSVKNFVRTVDIMIMIIKKLTYISITNVHGLKTLLKVIVLLMKPFGFAMMLCISVVLVCLRS